MQNNNRDREEGQGDESDGGRITPPPGPSRSEFLRGMPVLLKPVKGRKRIVLQDDTRKQLQRRSLELRDALLKCHDETALEELSKNARVGSSDGDSDHTSESCYCEDGTESSSKNVMSAEEQKVSKLNHVASAEEQKSTKPKRLRSTDRRETFTNSSDSSVLEEYTRDWPSEISTPSAEKRTRFEVTRLKNKEQKNKQLKNSPASLVLEEGMLGWPSIMSMPSAEKHRQFEEARLKNIEEKNKMLKLGGFNPVPINLASLKTKKSAKPTIEKDPKTKNEKRRPSAPPLTIRLRSRAKAGMSQACTEPEKQEESEEEEEEEEEDEDGPVEMSPINEKDQEMHEEFMSKVIPMLKVRTRDTKTPSLEQYTEQLMTLRLDEDSIKKVGVSRTVSMAIHPSESKLLIAAGDKLGYLGLWDVNSSNNPVVYKPHRAPVFCSSFCAQFRTHLYTTCINGVVKRCDLEKCTFEKVYSSVVESKSHTPWHHLRNSNELLVAHGDGSVGLVDMRVGKDVVQLYKCHARSVRTVQTNPSVNEYFVTASGIGQMGIWDIRSVKNHAKPLYMKNFQAGLKSAFFSPNGQILLSTGNDNRLRLFHMCDLQPGKLKERVSTTHNNFTGRWLTPFKATWHPKRSDVFVIGSMDRIRTVDVISSAGVPIRKITDPLLNTVLSVVQCHPKFDVIAGANSSGRIHVFKPPN